MEELAIKITKNQAITLCLVQRISERIIRQLNAANEGNAKSGEFWQKLHKLKGIRTMNKYGYVTEMSLPDIKKFEDVLDEMLVCEFKDIADVGFCFDAEEVCKTGEEKEILNKLFPADDIPLDTHRMSVFAQNARDVICDIIKKKTIKQHETT